MYSIPTLHLSQQKQLIVDLREEIETHFTERFCRDLEIAIKLRFPNIEELQVEMDTEGTAHIIFNETEYSEKEVLTFVKELRNLK